MKFSATGILRHIWDAPVAEISLFVPHKAILNAAETILYVADRENHRVLSYDITKTTSRGRELSSTMDGAPYSISFNGSVSSGPAWPMLGVFGGQREDDKLLMGFVMDNHGKLVGSWGPTKVRCLHCCKFVLFLFFIFYFFYFLFFYYYFYSNLKCRSISAKPYFGLEFSNCKSSIIVEVIITA